MVAFCCVYIRIRIAAAIAATTALRSCSALLSITLPNAVDVSHLKPSYLFTMSKQYHQPVDMLGARTPPDTHNSTNRRHPL